MQGKHVGQGVDKEILLFFNTCLYIYMYVLALHTTPLLTTLAKNPSLPP